MKKVLIFFYITTFLKHKGSKKKRTAQTEMRREDVRDEEDEPVDEEAEKKVSFAV
jgi:hypothetical protein